MQKNAFRSREGFVRAARGSRNPCFLTKTLPGLEPGSHRFPITTGKKLMMVMRTTAFILLAFCLHVSTRSVSQNVTISAKDLPLSKVFTEIKKQTGYTVFGNASLLRQTSNVSISVSNMP